MRAGWVSEGTGGSVAALVFGALPALAEDGPWDIQFAAPFVTRDVAVIDLDMDRPDQIAAAKARGQRLGRHGGGVAVGLRGLPGRGEGAGMAGLAGGIFPRHPPP